MVTIYLGMIKFNRKRVKDELIGSSIFRLCSNWLLELLRTATSSSTYECPWISKFSNAQRRTSSLLPCRINVTYAGGGEFNFNPGVAMTFTLCE